MTKKKIFLQFYTKRTNYVDMILLDNVANFLSVKKEFQSKYVVHGPHHSPEQKWLELQSILKSIFSFKFYLQHNVYVILTIF